MTETDTSASRPEKSSAAQSVAVIVLLTAVSAGAGALSSLHLMSTSQRVAEAKKETQEQPAPAATLAPGARLRKLSPVVTNMASPPNTWVRLEASVITEPLSEEEAVVLTARVSEDVVAYLRTISPEQIEGARGLQYLREDLNERAAIRSSGKVRELIIETLVVQ